MINCGGMHDIVDLLEPEEKVTFFILDSHRPYDLCNIYSERQVQILGEPPEDEKIQIPEYDDVYKDESVSYLTKFHPLKLLQVIFICMI